MTEGGIRPRRDGGPARRLHALLDSCVRHGALGGGDLQIAHPPSYLRRLSSTGQA